MKPLIVVHPIVKELFGKRNDTDGVAESIARDLELRLGEGRKERMSGTVIIATKDGNVKRGTFYHNGKPSFATYLGSLDACLACALEGFKPELVVAEDEDAARKIQDTFYARGYEMERA